MKFRPRDIGILSVCVVGILAALFFLFGPLASSGEPTGSATPTAVEDDLAPIDKKVTEAPVVAPSTSAPTPTETSAPVVNDWDGGSGPGPESDDPGVLASKATAEQFIPIYRNSVGYQYADSFAYLDELMEKNLITQNFYDTRRSGAPAPSRTQEDKIEVVTSDIDCVIASQAGPLVFEESGSFRCFYKSRWESNGSSVSEYTLDDLALAPIDGLSTTSLNLQFAKDGDAWKVDGIGQ